MTSPGQLFKTPTAPKRSYRTFPFEGFSPLAPFCSRGQVAALAVLQCSLLAPELLGCPSWAGLSPTLAHSHRTLQLGKEPRGHRAQRQQCHSHQCPRPQGPPGAARGCSHTKGSQLQEEPGTASPGSLCLLPEVGLHSGCPDSKSSARNSLGTQVLPEGPCSLLTEGLGGKGY